MCVASVGCVDGAVLSNDTNAYAYAYDARFEMAAAGGERRASSRLKTRIGRLSLCSGVLGFVLLIIAVATQVRRRVGARSFGSCSLSGMGAWWRRPFAAGAVRLRRHVLGAYCWHIVVQHALCEDCVVTVCVGPGGRAGAVAA